MQDRDPPPADPESQRRWGEGAVDLARWNLPALKAQRVVEVLPRHLPRPVFLDYGCGEGKLLKTLAQRFPGAELHGVDVQVPGKVEGFSFHLLHDGRADLVPGSVDAVTSVDVFEHVPDLADTLGYVASLLRPQGLLVGFLPLEGERLSLYGLYRGLLGQDLYVRTKEHVHAYTRAEFVGLLERRFRVESLSHSYHVVGSALDATFFALCALPSMGRWWWKSNTIYHPQKKKGLLDHAMNLMNGVCYVESSLMADVPMFATGLHFVARKA
jgi:SAM-dependent methyltransferase